ncbi:MAG: hypothetical protein COB93_05220 [Sneathiella sp.]|nr:MAG: hypothetical protein COB93_05220 [Sneathiella sp.]
MLMGTQVRKLWMMVIPLVLSVACDQEEQAVEQIRAIKPFAVTEPSSGNIHFYPGTIDAADSSGLSFRISGTVLTVDAKLGDEVAKGQVLATLDKEPYQLDLQATEAEFQKANSSYTEAKNNFERQSELFTKGWISKAALDQAQSSMANTKSQISYASSRVSQAQRNLSDTTLVAPFAGIIGTKTIDPFVDVTAGQKIMTVESAEAFEITISIPEKFISRVTLGMPATITFPAVEGSTLDGRITEIGRVASSANIFPVKVSLSSPPTSIRGGMTAEVKLLFATDNSKNGYYIPLIAISPGDDAAEGYVFVFDPETSTIKKTPIAGATVRDNMIGVSGVKAGDVIASAGVSFLNDGQKVKLMQAKPE